MVVALLLIATVRPGWDVLLMNSGVYMNLQDLDEDATWADFEAYTQENNVAVFAEEGLTASVLVADQPEFSNRYLAVNGKVEASTSGDMETQLMATHLPLLLHAAPRDVMVIGLASGISVGGAAAHPVERVRVVEVEAAMVPAARLFSEFNGNVLEDPRVEVSINDARNELEFSPQMYDVIASEPSNPWMTVASNLFTEEFFALARTRLRQGGIFCQWLQTYYLPTDDMRSIISAFRSAFPHVWVFETFDGTDLLLVGSTGRLELDLARMDERIGELRVRMDLARINVDSAVDVLPLFRLGDSEVDRLLDGAPRNTDDNARVEFSAPKAIYATTMGANLEHLGRFAADPLDYVTVDPGDDQALNRLRLELARAWARRGNPGRAASEARTLLNGSLADEAELFLTSLNPG
jgi:spermidine synthase